VVVAVAHDEDVVAGAGAIAQWLANQSTDEPVFLIELQQELKMPLIEIWMGLLLSQQQYEWQQIGEFYNQNAIWVPPSSETSERTA